MDVLVAQEDEHPGSRRPAQEAVDGLRHDLVALAQQPLRADRVPTDLVQAASEAVVQGLLLGAFGHVHGGQAEAGALGRPQQGGQLSRREDPLLLPAGGEVLRDHTAPLEVFELRGVGIGGQLHGQMGVAR